MHEYTDVFSHSYIIQWCRLNNKWVAPPIRPTYVRPIYTMPYHISHTPSVYRVTHSLNHPSIHAILSLDLIRSVYRSIIKKSGPASRGMVCICSIYFISLSLPLQISSLSLTIHHFVKVSTIYSSHDLAFDVNHVRPSYNPSPVVAHDGWTYQFLSRIRVSPNFSWISWGFIAEIIFPHNLSLLLHVL